jgi:hypothetical protein
MAGVDKIRDSYNVQWLASSPRSGLDDRVLRKNLRRYRDTRGKRELTRSVRSLSQLDELLLTRPANIHAELTVGEIARAKFSCAGSSAGNRVAPHQHRHDKVGQGG